MLSSCVRLGTVAALLAASPYLAAQAVFIPIPNPSPQPATVPGACFLSGGDSKYAARISADGSTVALKIYSPGATAGLPVGQFALWTENGGTTVIAPDDGYGSNFGWGVSGISSDGRIVYGADWVWRLESGYQSLSSTLSQLGFSTIFGCSDDGKVLSGFRPTDPGLPYPGDYFRWQIDQAPPQFLPRDSQHPAGYFLFNCISGDGAVVGGHTWAPSVPFFQTYAGVLVTASGTTLVTPESVGNATLVNDLSSNGTVAVGQASLPGPLSSFGLVSFRSTPAGGLQILPTPGSTSSANACSALGDVVVGSYLTFGSTGTRAYYWKSGSGAVDLQTELINNQGVGAVLQGWTLKNALDVSADGRVIVGTGRNPAGCDQAFVVRFPKVPATVASFSVPCFGPQGPLVLNATKAPYVGTPATSQCSNSSPQALQFGVVGLSQIATPLSSILPVAAPNCNLLANADSVTLLPVANGVARQQIQIPTNPTLVGLTYVQQVLRLDISASTGAATSFAGSNGLSLKIGSY